MEEEDLSFEGVGGGGVYSGGLGEWLVGGVVDEEMRGEGRLRYLDFKT